MKCPCCGGAELIHGTRDVPYHYRGRSTSFPAITADFCPECEEIVLDPQDARRLDKLMLDFNKRVNAESGDPAFIAQIRKKLALDQKEAGEIFGGGVNAFSRYENGKSKPPVALLKLLKVLDRHPDLIDEIRG